MKTIPSLLLAGAGLAAGYAYVGYPAILNALGRRRGRPDVPHSPAGAEEWPRISITVPAYNEEAQIRGTLDSLLALDYPADRRQILVVSDGSTDRTNEIVAEYADRGVELVAMSRRMGKTAAENAARPHLRGDIIVNTDASIRIQRDALKPLIGAFRDPAIGLASGRDVSVGPAEERHTAGESSYVGYEMWIRQLETRVHGIVGASGCFYAIRAPLHHSNQLPEGLSRDFAAALVTHEAGFRAVSIDAAVCFVPRSGSLRREYRRKVRTMARGLQTLSYKRHLLNPTEHGVFAWMLFSHKLGRWLVPLTIPAGAAGLVGLAPEHRWAQLLLATGAAGGVLAGIGWFWPEDQPLPRPLALPTYASAGIVAAIHAWGQALGGKRNAIWEPTRREVLNA